MQVIEGTGGRYDFTAKAHVCLARRKGAKVPDAALATSVIREILAQGVLGLNSETFGVTVEAFASDAADLVTLDGHQYDLHTGTDAETGDRTLTGTMNPPPSYERHEVAVTVDGHVWRWLNGLAAIRGESVHQFALECLLQGLVELVPLTGASASEVLE